MKLSFVLPGLLHLKTSLATPYEKGLLEHPLNQPWHTWKAKVLPPLIQQVKELPPELQVWLPIDWSLNCQALFYRERSIGVAVLYYRALADLLTTARLIAHEKWIQSWDGSRLLVDRENPHVEFVISRCNPEFRRTP